MNQNVKNILTNASKICTIMQIRYRMWHLRKPICMWSTAHGNELHFFFVVFALGKHKYVYNVVIDIKADLS